MFRSTFVSIALVFTVFCGGMPQLHAQNFREDTLTVSPVHQADTLDIPPVPETVQAPAEPTAEEMLKAKVDSLKHALSEVSPERMRQSIMRRISEADSLRKIYEFQRAEDILKRAYEDADSTQTGTIKEALDLNRNALSMTGYCSSPTVVARERFAIEDFFLMYPMEDGAWRRTPNPLDPSTDGMNRATYIPDDARTVYFSAPDSDGIRNIYMTHSSEGVWSAPQLINESITSVSDEIFPVLSPDERTLYFSSKGLYGMGGYDLYMSRWNRETNEWEQPVNMGFPYSSPADDFLFVNTSDGRYSVFASNRECTPDSVYIYILEYDALPLRRSVADARELRRLASLNPAARFHEASEPSDEESSETSVSDYMKKMADVRVLRDSIYQLNKELDSMRSVLTEMTAEEQSGHIAAILAKEQGLPLMQDRLDRAVKDLQDIELDFLASGVLIDPAAPQEEADAELRQRPQEYEFIRHRYGEDLAMNIMATETGSGSRFNILTEGIFADSKDIPGGLVYQIQLASSSGKLRTDDLNGLSPVFEKMSTSLRYTYTVGVFRSYGEALTHLNSVRKRGFPDAFITAGIDGRTVPVESARSQESRLIRHFHIRIVSEAGVLPALALTLIHQQGEKEIVREEENGTFIFMVGTFDDRSQAESLITALRATGVSSASIVEL